MMMIVFEDIGENKINVFAKVPNDCQDEPLPSTIVGLACLRMLQVALADEEICIPGDHELH